MHAECADFALKPQHGLVSWVNGGRKDDPDCPPDDDQFPPGDLPSPDPPDRIPDTIKPPSD